MAKAVVGLAVDVSVGRGRTSRRLVHFELVELLVQDIADPFAGTDAGGQGAATGRFQTVLGVTFAVCGGGRSQPAKSRLSVGPSPAPSGQHNR